LQQGGVKAALLDIEFQFVYTARKEHLVEEDERKGKLYFAGFRLNFLQPQWLNEETLQD
jgi:hypothetical protein